MFQQSQWQPVFETHNEAEARVVAGLLETRGIMARLHPEPVAQAMGLPESRAHTILVDARDYEQARKFLRHNLLQ